MAMIFHIIPKDEWLKQKAGGEYSPLSLRNEGFIHCCKADQVLKVAQAFFGRLACELLLLRIFEQDVLPPIRYETPAEAPMSNIKFPHIFGPLNLNAVDKVFPLTKSITNEFIIPEDLLL